MSIFIGDPSGGWAPIGTATDVRFERVASPPERPTFRLAESVTFTVHLTERDEAALLAALWRSVWRFPEVAPVLLHGATVRALLETS